jgi:hypothetical protein
MRPLLPTLLTLALTLAPLPAMAQVRSDAAGGGGSGEIAWTPGEGHALVVQRARAELRLIDAQLSLPGQDSDWLRLHRLRLLYLLGVEEEGRLAQVDAEAQRLRSAGTAVAPADRALIDAYAAATEVLRAKHAFWPQTKVRHLRTGLDRLDALVSSHPAHAEIRYLRLVSTAYLPSILGRREGVSADAARLVELLEAGARHALPPGTVAGMTGVLVEAGRLPAPLSRRARELYNEALARMTPEPTLPVPPFQARGDQGGPDSGSSP